MKVIDLLNKIANGEEVPKKIKYNETLYSYNKDIDYENENDCFLFGDRICICPKDLNSLVEIIEDKEDKKIEKIQLTNGGLTIHLSDFEDYNLTIIDREIIKKLNEIIERLNGEDNVKD